MDKPLFIPLKTEYFEAFESGEKEAEIRRYGARWNTDTCYAGRRVVLSCGYGKARRLKGFVEEVRLRQFDSFTVEIRSALEQIYPDYKSEFIVIYICIERK